MSGAEYNEGDLVEGVKGESVIRGRLDNIGNLIIDGLDWRVASLIRNGFTIRVIEKAAPVVVLPTEPGCYVDEFNHTFAILGFNGGKWCGPFVPTDDASKLIPPFTRLEPVSETAKKVLDRVASWWEFGPPTVWAEELLNIGIEFGVTE